MAFQGLSYDCEQSVARSLSQKPFYNNKTKDRFISTLITEQLQTQCLPLEVQTVGLRTPTQTLAH